jgi:hypothetical protein
VLAAAVAFIALGASSASPAVAGRPPADPVIVAVGDIACQSLTMSDGVLKMTLHAGSYDYEWVPLPGEPAFEDSGTVACT